MDDFEPGIPEDERAALDELASRLLRDRPVPRPAFRGDLSRRLVTMSRTSTRALRVRALAFVAAGVVLIGVAGLSVLDIGPLAPASPSKQMQVSLR